MKPSKNNASVATQPSKKNVFSQMTHFIFWTFFLIAQLIVASLIAWEIGAQLNFGYSVGYSTLNIEQHIQTYAPQNIYKADFVFTSKKERVELFEQTVDAIQHQGVGLERIFYELPNRNRVPLYTSAEITHLTDVAQLINHFFTLGIIAAVLWILCLWIIRRYQLVFPSAKAIALGLLGLSTAIICALFLVGPVKVFYWMHTQIFPQGHQWYFYYQESLMATFMKAPDLFGLIALMLAIIFLIIFIGITFAVKYFSKKSSQP